MPAAASEPVIAATPRFDSVWNAAMELSSEPPVVVRSVKFTAGSFRPNRYFADIDRAPAGTNGSEAAMLNICGALAAPEAALAQAKERFGRLDRASAIGVDMSGGRCGFRLYFAYEPQAERARLVPRTPSTPADLAGESIEWIAGSDRIGSKTYELFTPGSDSDAVRVLTSALGRDERPTSVPTRRIAGLVLDAVRRSDYLTKILLVCDRDSSRFSCDFKLSITKPLRLGDILDAAGEWVRALGVPRAIYDRWAAANRAAIVENIAAGRDEAGRPFITMYYGRSNTPPPFLSSVDEDEPRRTIRPVAVRCVARGTTSDISQAMDRGLEALRTCSESRLERSYLADGRDAPAIRSPFVDALVVAALARSGGPQAGPVIEDRCAALRQLRSGDGTWIFDRDGLELPPDSDDTACAAAALRLAGGKKRESYESLEAILRFRDGTGRCRTWLGDSVRHNDVDVVVNANVLFLARLAGVRLQGVEHYVLSFVERYGLDCRRGSAYYRSPDLFAYFLARWAAGQPAIAGEVSGHIPRSSRTGRGDPLSIACRAITLATLGETTLRSALVDALLESQRGDGFWPASPLFEGFETYSYSSAEVTTALCIEALSHAAVASLRPGQR